MLSFFSSKNIYRNFFSIIDGIPFLILIAAPTRATSPLLDEVAITLQDVTTQESFLKKCIVDGNAYSHSQTVMTDMIYYVMRNRDKIVEFFAIVDKE